MKTKLLTICLILFTSQVFAEDCKGIDSKKWTDCYGTSISADGSKYVGEWKNGKWHGQGTITSPNGYKYIGEWRNNKFHGHGTMIYPSGNKYIGDFKDGKQHGKGTITSPQGHKYVGETKNNYMHGYGTMIYPSGNKYIGEFKNNKRHGHGAYISNSGLALSYVGGWRNDKQNGQAEVTLSNGQVFYANYKDDNIIDQNVKLNKSGKITFTYNNGDTYVGDHKNGQAHGIGIYIETDGSKYVGEFKNNMKHGQGTLTYANGDILVGQWRNNTYLDQVSEGEYEKDFSVNQKKATDMATLQRKFYDKEINWWSETRELNSNYFVPNKFYNTKKYNAYKECKGTDVRKYSNCFGTYLITKNNLIYRGTFINGQFDGLGYLVGFDKSITESDSKQISLYYGEFSKGKYHGLGNLHTEDDYAYTGEFKNMIIDGFGMLYKHKLKLLYVGDFKNNMKHGVGHQQWPEGVYKGEWKKDFFNGRGKLTNVNGEEKIGYWKNGNYVGK